MRALHAFVLFLALAPSLAAGSIRLQDPSRTDQDTVEAGAVTAAPELDSPIVRARRFTSRWNAPRYAIRNPRTNLGVYHQKNVLHELPDGTAVLEFKDSIQLYRNDDPIEYRTECAVNEEFEVLSISGRFGIMGNASVRFRDGKAVGNSSKSGDFGMEVPGSLSSQMTLLRGLRHQSLEQDEASVWENFVIEGAPKEAALRKVTLTYLGDEEVVVQGVAHTGRKYELLSGKRMQVFYWFGSDGQLLKIVEGRQIWELMPPGAEKPLKIERKNKKKKAAEDSGESTD